MTIANWTSKSQSGAMQITTTRSSSCSRIMQRITWCASLSLSGLSASAYSFTWGPGRVDFRAEGPDGTTIKTQTFTRRIPAEGGGNARTTCGWFPGSGHNLAQSRKS